jgi:hypothetical protein
MQSRTEPVQHVQTFTIEHAHTHSGRPDLLVKQLHNDERRKGEKAKRMDRGKRKDKRFLDVRENTGYYYGHYI